MVSVSVHEAKTHLSSLISDVQRRGEKVIICRHGKAVAELVAVPHGSRTRVSRKLSRIGIHYDPTSPTVEEWDDT